MTFDIAIVCLSILLINRMLDFSPHMAFTIPAIGDDLRGARACLDALSPFVAYAGTLAIVFMAIGIAAMPEP